MARTPLFRLLEKSLREAARRVREYRPEESSSKKRMGRRDFLRAASAAMIATGGIGFLRPQGTWASAQSARVVVVGGGIAGLNAAYQLKKLGIDALVYEASNRIGGRIMSVPNALGQGLITEFGAEFIDSDHFAMWDLIREFNLPTMDMWNDEVETEEAHVFRGTDYSEEQIIEAFIPLAERMDADLENIGEIVNFEEDGGAAELDQLSISQYMERIGASGWIRQFLEIAYVAEYGLEATEQSCLNLLFLIGTDTTDGFSVYGISDERFKVEGGNSRIIEELARRLEGQINLGYRLTGLAQSGEKYQLTLVHGGHTDTIDADFVVLAVPFTILRKVQMDVEMPEVKRRAIQELGYGMNAKVMLGVGQRVWRQKNHGGTFYSDTPAQCGWDSSRMQAGEAGSLTVYLGGNEGLAAGEGSPGEAAARYLDHVEAIFPGIKAAHNHKVARFHWPSHPLTFGSYSCYKVGQWTSIGGAEGLPVGNLFFAGEHCSYDYQGFMNGGAETGAAAAEAIAERLGVAVGAATSEAEPAAE